MAKPKANTFDLAMAQLNNSDDRDKLYSKLDEHQRSYYSEIMDKSVVCVNAPSGTGKSQTAVLAGLTLLAQGKVSRLVYVRFPDDRSLKLGFLPGEQEAKEFIYMLPLYESCEECGIQREAVDELVKNNLIELTTDIGMRGRNLKNTFVIVDESQSGNIKDLQLVLTRLHDSSKCVLIGHSGQMDSDIPLIGGRTTFEVYIKHLTKKPWATQCELPINYRGKISKWADEIQKTVQEVQ